MVYLTFLKMKNHEVEKTVFEQLICSIYHFFINRNVNIQINTRYSTSMVTYQQIPKHYLTLEQMKEASWSMINE